MEKNKIVISCPACGNPMRIPSNKHIRLACSACGEKLEYDNGILVSSIEVLETLSDTRTRTSSNRTKAYRKTRYWWHYIFYSLIIVVAAISLRNESCNTFENISELQVAVDSVSSIPTEITLTADSSTQHSQLFKAAYPEDDSARKSLIEDALDKINDVQDILDVIKDIAELLMSDEIDNDHTRARADYQCGK